MKGRPLLHTSYASDMALLNTRAKRVAAGVVLGVALVLPFLLADEILQLLAVCCIAAIGAIGLGLVTGYAGQVSLGHAFFLAIGAYTAAAISGDPDGRTIGLGITNIAVWLPAAGLVAGARGRAGRAAGDPAARPLPGDRDPRPGLHRPAHLQRMAGR